MDDPLDDILGKHQAVDPLDDILGPHTAAPAEPEDNSWGTYAKDLGTAALDGLTLNSGAEVVSAGRASTDSNVNYGDDARAREAHLKKFYNDHPWMGNIAYGAGMIAGFTPFGRAAGTAAKSAGALAKIKSLASTILPGKNFAAAARGGAETAGPVASATSRLLLRAGAPGTAKSINTLSKSRFNQYGLGSLKVGGLMATGNAPIEWDDNASLAHNSAGTMQEVASNHPIARAINEPGSSLLEYSIGGAGGVAADKLLTKAGDFISDKFADPVMRARAASGDQNALRAIESDGASIDQLVEHAVGVNAPGTSTLTPTQRLQIVAAMHQRVEGGMSPAAAARDIAQGTLMTGAQHRRGAAAQSTLERWARDIYNQYNEVNQYPLQLHEMVADATGGEAKNSFMAYKYGVNLPESRVASDATNFARTRQAESGDSMGDMFRRHLGDGDVERAIGELETQAGAANDLYKPVTDAFNMDQGRRGQLANALEAVAMGNNAKYFHDQTPIGKAIREQLESFHIDKPTSGNPNQLTLPQGPPNAAGQLPQTTFGGALNNTTPMRAPLDDLQHFITARRGLEQAIQTSTHEHKATPLTIALRDLKSDIDNAVRPIAPEWAAANDARAGAGALRRAYEEFVTFPLKVGGKGIIDRNRMLQRFERMTPEQQQMASRGLMTQLENMIMKQGRYHDVSKMFNDRGNTERIFRRIIGDEATEAVMNHVGRTAIGTRTAGALKGSHTEPMRLTGERYRSNFKLLAKLWNPRAMAEEAGNKVANEMEARAGDSMLRQLTADTSDPVGLSRALNNLRALQGMVQRRSNYRQQAHDLSPIGSMGATSMYEGIPQ